MGFLKVFIRRDYRKFLKKKKNKRKIVLKYKEKFIWTIHLGFGQLSFMQFHFQWEKQQNN